MACQPLELGEARRTEALLRALGPIAGARLIDIGCGNGVVARALAKAGADVCGYDTRVESGEGIGDGGGRYRLAQASARAIPEEDGSADIVVFCYSLHRLPRAWMGAALAEARRVLTPTGRLCVAEPLAAPPADDRSGNCQDDIAVRRHATAAIAAHAAPFFEREARFIFDDVERINGRDDRDLIAGDFVATSHPGAEHRHAEPHRHSEAIGQTRTAARHRARINLFF